MPVPKPSRPRNLRLIRLLPPGTLRRRRVLRGTAETALQVVEDGAHRRRRPRRGRDPARVPSRDEDAPLGGRRFALRDADAIGTKLAAAPEQPGPGAAKS